MARNQNPQSQSQPGATNDNPNEDVADGNQSTIQPGAGERPPSGEFGGESNASDGGNAAANQGGANGPAAGGQ